MAPNSDCGPPTPPPEGALPMFDENNGPPTPPCLSILSQLDDLSDEEAEEPPQLELPSQAVECDPLPTQIPTPTVTTEEVQLPLDDLSNKEAKEPSQLELPSPPSECALLPTQTPAPAVKTEEVQLPPVLHYDGLPAVLSMAVKNEDDVLSQGDELRARKPAVSVKDEDDEGCSSSDEDDSDIKQEDTKRTTSTPTVPNLHEFRSRKAGCENVDKAHVEAVMRRLTEGGRYHKRQEEKWRARVERHQAIKRQVESLRAEPAKLRREQYLVDHNIIPPLEANRPRGRVMVCVDMDCYYAQVEALDDPSLIGKPHAVTMGMGNHCILATTSYEARAKGVKGGIAAFVGKEICPELILIPARMGRYAEISRMIDAVLVKYDPKFCKASVDEAFLDITDYLVESGNSPAEVVNEMRAGIKEITGLTASAGCAPCLMVAKIASDMKKPDGQTIVLPGVGADERKFVMDFIGKLPLIKVPGIGSVSEKLLQDALGFETVADIHGSRAIISSVFTPFKTRFLLRIALGISCPWTDMYYEKVVRKGIGTNRTFGRERDETKLCEWLRKICEYLEYEVGHAGAVGGQTFTVKLKTGQFRSIRKSITLPAGAMLCTADDFELFAKRVLRDNLPGEYRRIGLKLNKVTWKKRPRGSLKKYLKLDDDEVLDKQAAEEIEHNSVTKLQIEQARARARKFFYEQFTADDANKEVQFKPTAGRCAACDAPRTQASQFKHMHPYHCPVCRARCFKYLPALHRHLDTCVGGCGDAVPLRVRTVKKEEARIMGFFKCSKNSTNTIVQARAKVKLERPAKRTTGKRGRPRNGVKPEVKRRKQIHSHAEVFAKREVELSGRLVCPVCSTARFDDNTKLNEHVDSCLTYNSTQFKKAINS